jgi:Ni/Co efflux regulator RcnB
MKKLALAAVAVATLAGSAATAQPYGYGRYDHDNYASMEQRKMQIDRRIDQGLRSGQLTRREAWQLRNEFNQIARLEARYRSNGLSAWEARDLDRRLDQLAMQVRYERRDDQRRYGYNQWNPPY